MPSGFGRARSPSIPARATSCPHPRGGLLPAPSALAGCSSRTGWIQAAANGTDDSSAVTRRGPGNHPGTVPSSWPAPNLATASA